MGSYSNFSVRDLVDAFASTAPAPAGGSASALTGATAASLLLMAADIRLSRPAASPELAESADRLRSVRPTLIGLIDRDADAYALVVAALRLPDEDDESRERRRIALASAMQAATDVPLETMRASRLALRAAPAVASHCVRSTSADVAVAIELLHAAIRGAGRTVDANLASSADVKYVERVRTEREQLQSESAADVEHALSLLNGRR
jgi:formiminotetrahydrofolate cyclodeaminase